MLAKLKSLFREIDPDPDILLRKLSHHITKKDIEEISNADNGWGLDDNRTILTGIRDTGEVPCPLEWEPKEVCQLVRWNEPAVFDPVQVCNATRDDLQVHRQRAFACAILLRAWLDDSEGRLFGENQSAAVLLASSLVLREPMVSLATRLIAASAIKPVVCDEEERPVLVLGVLIGILAATELPRNGETLCSLVQWIETADTELRESESSLVRSHDFVLGLTGYHIRHPMWRSLVQHFLIEPQRPHPPEADEILRAFGSLINST